MKTNKMTGKFARRFIAAFATVLGWTASAAAQTTEVVGTGNPNLDVPAVQAAVDQGGEVILKGHFSFDRPPTIQPNLPGFPLATVLVSKGVAISGVLNEDSEMTSIEGGTTPFEVEARGFGVTIQGLRFIRPKFAAIHVSGVNGLVIASCKIEGVEPVDHNGEGIVISTTFFPPTPDQPGHPENISGTLLIVNNDIDVGGTAQDNTVGVLIFSVGVPAAEVEVYVSGNKIRNTTEPAINLRRVVGRAFIEGNVLTTGSVAGRAAGPEVIRVVNIGSYLIAHNSIDCGWAQGAGIGVFSQFGQWPMERASVVDNDVIMSAPEGTVFGPDSAGISIKGFARGNVVLNNRIRGRARAALAVNVFQGAGPVPGVPANNAFVLNRFDDFEASLADVFVGASVKNTRIVGQGTVEDNGVGTVIVRVPRGDREND